MQPARLSATRPAAVRLGESRPFVYVELDSLIGRAGVKTVGTLVVATSARLFCTVSDQRLRIPALIRPRLAAT